jgi:predicted RNA methylase
MEKQPNVASMLWRIKPQPASVVGEMFAAVPDSILLDCNRKVADLAMGDGSYLAEVLRRRIANGASYEQAAATLYGYESNPVYLQAAAKLNNLHGANLAILKPATDLDDFEMQFDVVIGNPPYNNTQKKGNATAGTSLWIKFLEVVPKLLKPNGWCSLLVPQVVLNTNSAGYRKIRDLELVAGNTGMESHFPGIATGIAQITFINRLPSGSSYHVINGIKVDRDRVMALPKNVDATALAIFEKISQFDPIPWVRSGWEGFQSSDKSRVIAKSFMDRDSRYTFYNAEETEERALTKVNICWTDRYNPEKLRKYMLNKLFSFHCQQTAYNGNISIGVMRTLTLPTNWEELVTDEQVYEAYGLTQTEINYLEQAVK